jgi:hypothetical protein
MDHSMWYFDAPSKFTGDKGIAYGGAIEFTVGAFSGDFGGSVGGGAAAVRITCDECEGPVGPGITLVFPVSALTAFVGDVTRVNKHTPTPTPSPSDGFPRARTWF